ncbi:glycosyl transferase family 1 [Paenibacillus sp. VTT E-133280]|uniref:glycosyltransferase family 1 protein n=1 Tax=Paenibacillus sp. VTT E-133280 TaxID=1986222 RepID=UPI000BA115AF|nr:glycosyltransferase family 1 protein [Paenibacillus sp. VTT E-133280]OZQ61776.1 glycosyl transferase family 1 [Paenibacillus sp. VTT E-133280]
MINKLRILHVLGGLNRGGAETMVMNLYRNIDRSKIQFDFVVHTTNKCDYDDEIRELGGKIYRMPRYNGKNHLDYKREWNVFFFRHPEIRIVHGHMRSTASIYLKIAKSFGARTIAHSHSTSNGVGISALVKNIMQYPIRYNSDYLFSCSQKAGEWLFGKYHFKKKNSLVVKNAIESERYIFNIMKRDKLRKELGIDGKFVIGHVGRFCVAKNHRYLIDIFESIYNTDNNSLLLLVGDGELLEEIKSIVNDKKLSNAVMFLGNRSDVFDLLQCMDTFVFPSKFEGLGISIIEAQASSLPCIISENIPLEAHITKLVQVVSLNRSPDVWAEHILREKDNSRRVDMSGEIKKKGYNVNFNTKWLEEFYCEII